FFSLLPTPPSTSLFPYTTLFRSKGIWLIFSKWTRPVFCQKQHGVQGLNSAFQLAIARTQSLHGVLLYLEFGCKCIMLLAYFFIHLLRLLEFLGKLIHLRLIRCAVEKFLKQAARLLCRLRPRKAAFRIVVDILRIPHARS